MCPVNLFQLYVSKLDDRCPYLWQKPRQSAVHYNDSEWYEPWRVGHNTLETFMKTLCEEANLHGIYTNHSIRGTCINNLDKSGFEARHIIALSSHKSGSTIKDYAEKCPKVKKKEMFNALASKLQPVPIAPKTKPTQTVTMPTTPPPADTPNFTINIPELENNDISNLDFLEMDTTDDDLLVKILTQTEDTIQEKDKTTPQKQNQMTQGNVTNVTNTMFNLLQFLLSIECIFHILM